MRITAEERRARLAHRHRLLPGRRTDDLPALVDDLVALHSTDPVTVYLSAMVRMAHPSVEAVERALYEDRSLVRHHAMRRTLWVARPDVVRLMHAAATRKIAAAEHRRTATLLAENGIDDPDAWLADARSQALAALDRLGPSTTRALGRAVPLLRHPIRMAPGKSYGATVGAHTRVLMQLGFEGAVVRTRPTGSWVNGAYTWAAFDDWVEGGLGEHDVASAAAALAARYLEGFGPATTVDLQWWTGWTGALTAQALADCGAEQVELADGPGWVAAGDPGTPPERPWVALLPSLDPTTMGWKQRGWYLPASAADAFDNVGNGGATIWVDGRVVGAWAQREDGRIALHWFEQVASERRDEVAERAEQLRAMVGDTRFTVRFPGGVQRTLR